MLTISLSDSSLVLAFSRCLNMLVNMLRLGGLVDGGKSGLFVVMGDTYFYVY